MKTKSTLSIWGLGLSLLLVTGISSCKKEKQEELQFKELTAAGEISGTWEGNSIVTITEDVVIPKGQTLTIQAGAKIIFAGDNLGSATAPEFQVRGKLLVLGEPGKMVIFTVPTDKQTTKNRYLGLWGGIQCAATCDELAIKYARIEYAGAPAGPSSVFVEQGEDEGDPRYGIFFGNIDGKFALHHSEIMNMSDDGMRVIGGRVSICHNFMAYIGETGGEAINLKSGVEGDMAYNVFYNLATNGTKWSNSGSRSPQTDCNSYNNTFVNCGWRRNKEGRGASVNIEKGARGSSYNNLMVNCKYGIRVVGGDDAADLANTKSNYSWYFANEKIMVDEFFPTHGILDVTMTGDDVMGSIDENDPMFENYNVQTGKSENLDIANLDFHLKSGSNTLTGAYTSFSPKFSSLTIAGITFDTPNPSSYFGALATK
jgi:hypothetical protein